MNRLITYTFLSAILLSSQAVASRDKPFMEFLRGTYRTPFNSQVVAQKTPVFNYQCFYEFSFLRDIEAVSSGSASILNTDDCRLEVSTGATAGSKYRYETARYGIYDAGFGAEAGIAMFPLTKPEGDSKYKVGLSNGDDGVFFEIKKDQNLFVVKRDGTRILERKQKNWSVDNLDGSGKTGNPSGHHFQPFKNGYIYGIYFSWYSVGELCGVLWTPANNTDPQMKTLFTHCFDPDGISSITNPNLPVFASVTNGSDASGQDLKMKLGGRRYFILGKRDADNTFVSAFKKADTLPSDGSLEPIVCARREPDFPKAGEENTVSMAVTDTTISVGSMSRLGIYTSDSISGTFVDPSNANFENVSDSGTAVQFSLDASGMTNPILISTPKLQKTASGNKNKPSSSELFDSIEARIIRQRPTCLAGRSETGSDISIDATMTVGEVW